MSEGTFYNWKAKFFGMTVSEAKRLKRLEDREREAEDASGRTDSGSGCDEGASFKKLGTPAVKREAVAHQKALLGFSERRACRIVRAYRKMVRCGARAVRRTRCCAIGCGNWPTNADASVIAGSSSSCAARESLQASIGSIARMDEDQKAVPGDRFPDDTDDAQVEGLTQSDRHAGTNHSQGAAQRTLVAGMRRFRKQSGGLFSRRMGMTSLPTANASEFSTCSTTSSGDASRRFRTLRYPDDASHESYRL